MTKNKKRYTAEEKATDAISSVEVSALLINKLEQARTNRKTKRQR